MGRAVVGVDAVPVRFAAGFLAMDLAKYGTHWLVSSRGLSGPVHRVHHSDPDFDVSTSVRFHPIEPLIVLAADMAVILLLSPPPVAGAGGEIRRCVFQSSGNTRMQACRGHWIAGYDAG